MTPNHARPRRTGRTVVVAAALLVGAVGSMFAVRWATGDSRRAFLGADGWPVAGQAAFVVDGGPPAIGPRQHPAPIASVAKLMTAYVVVTRLPLRAGDQGRRFTVTARDVQDTTRRRARGESVVAVTVGERLSERQALTALLLPSANNVAVMITRLVDAHERDFLRRMNAVATRLGMHHTRYTDPSGFAPSTVSTAADQLQLARAAGRNPTLAAIAARRSAVIPVAGRVTNTDLLLGTHGVVGLKTGSDDAAGGCFVLHAVRVYDGRRRDVYVVVLGQHGRNALTAGLYAARQLLLSPAVQSAWYSTR